MDTSPVRIYRPTIARLRVIAAKRGTSHGVLLNAILADKDALAAALTVLDAKEKQWAKCILVDRRDKAGN